MPIPPPFRSVCQFRLIPALLCALAAGRAAAQDGVYPLGALDAQGYTRDGDSIRVQGVRSGGPLAVSGVRDRDEIVGAQVGSQFVPFDKNPRQYMRVLGEAIDAAMGGDGSLKFKLRLGREVGVAPVKLPVYGRFIAGYAIDKLAAEGKENKNERFFKGCAGWILAKDKAGQLAAGAPINPGLSWAGLALLGSPDPAHQAAVGPWAEAIQADWAKPNKRPNGGMGKDSYGQTLFSDMWGVLLLSEYNWCRPDAQRKAVLEKACDEMAQLLLNPSYVYKEPSWHKHDPGTRDPANPNKEYHKDRFVYVPGKTPDARKLAAAWWCWSHCAATSGVTVNPQAMRVARQYLLDLAMPKDAKGQRDFPRDKTGAYAFSMNREVAACLANALVGSRNREEAVIGTALAQYVLGRPFSLPESEWEMLAVCCLRMKVQGVAGYRQGFNEWRWDLSLMMQSDGEARLFQLATDPPSWEPNPLGGDKTLDANALSAFLLMAPARRLKIFGATRAPVIRPYDPGNAKPEAEKGTASPYRP